MLEFLDNTHVRVGLKRLVYFGGCNYLGLAWHSSLQAALVRASASGPFQTGASRQTTGEHPKFLQTERAIAGFFGTESAAFFPTGYLASMAALDGLRNRIDCVLIDAGAHRCLRDGARLTGHPVIEFPHRDSKGLRKAIQALPRGAAPLVATDGTGAIRPGTAPLQAFLDRLPSTGLLVVDDAHGAGVLGATGRGLVAHLGIQDPRVVQCVTFAKAFATAGGAVLGTTDLISQIRNLAGAYTGSTAQPLSLLGAVQASLRLVHRNPGRIRRFQSNQRLFADAVQHLARMETDPQTPVSVLYSRNEREATSLATELIKTGIHPPWIRYPGGPEGGFFRFAISAAHRPAEIRRLASTLTTLLQP